MSKEKKTAKKKTTKKPSAKKDKAEPKKAKPKAEEILKREEAETAEVEDVEVPEKLGTPSPEKAAEIEARPIAEEAPAAEEKEEGAGEEEEEMEIVEEKFYDLNLRRIWNAPREKRTPRAIRFLRDFIAHRMKTDEVSISEETNAMLWKRGISKPPRRIRVRAVKDKEGRVIVFPGEGK